MPRGVVRTLSAVVFECGGAAVGTLLWPGLGTTVAMTAGSMAAWLVV